jgi:hypothetical protein
MSIDLEWIEVWTEQWLRQEQSEGNKESSVIAKGIRERWTTNQLLEELDTNSVSLEFMLESFNSDWLYYCEMQASWWDADGDIHEYSSGFSLENIDGGCWRSGLSYS